MEKLLLNDILDRLDYIERYLYNQKKVCNENILLGYKKYALSGSYNFQNNTEIVLGQTLSVGYPIYIVCKVVSSENAVLRIKCGANVIGCGNIIKNDVGMLHIFAGYPAQNGTVSLSIEGENKAIEISNIVVLSVDEFDVG